MTNMQSWKKPPLPEGVDVLVSDYLVGQNYILRRRIRRSAV